MEEIRMEKITGDERRMTLPRILAYGAADLAGGGMVTSVSVLYTLFLTTVAGIPPLTVGMIFLIVKIVSAITNPVMGYITDHTRSRFGRRRLYFLFGCFPFFAIPWIVVDFGSLTLNTIWYGGTFILFNLFSTIVAVPYNSILPEMTTDYGVRSRAIGFRMVFSKIGTLIGTWVPLTIVGWFAVKSQGYLAMGIIIGIIFAVPWLITFLFTWERRGISVEREGTLGQEVAALFRSFLTTLRNSSFRKHIVMYLCALTTFDVFMALFIFVVTISMGREMSLARDILTTVQIFQFFGLPVATWLCCRYSNARAYMTAAVVLAVSIIAFTLQSDSASFWQLAGIGAFIGIGIGGVIMSSWNNLSFISDVDEMLTTRRREGVYAGFQSFIRQASQGLGMMLVNSALAAIGFVSGAEVQSEATREGIRTFLMLAPAGLLVIGIIFACLFKINKKNYDILMAEIFRLRAGGDKADVRPETRKVVEALTGHRYERLWNPDNAR
ncbi:MAG: MFS transporter [Negativicutes bacterium]|nr:MFS transporter [Negativicutes bacterium]